MNQNVKTCESSQILNGISFFGNTLELKKEKCHGIFTDL